MIIDRTQPQRPNIQKEAQDWAYQMQNDAEEKYYSKHAMQGWLLKYNDDGYPGRRLSDTREEKQYTVKNARSQLYCHGERIMKARYDGRFFKYNDFEMENFAQILKKELNEKGFRNVLVKPEKVEEETYIANKALIGVKRSIHKGSWISGERKWREQYGYIVFIHVEW